MEFLGEIVFGLVFEIAGELVGGVLEIIVEAVGGPGTKEPQPSAPPGGSLISLNLSD